MTTHISARHRVHVSRRQGLKPKHPWTFWIPFAVTGGALTLVLASLMIMSNI